MPLGRSTKSPLPTARSPSPANRPPSRHPRKATTLEEATTPEEELSASIGGTMVPVVSAINATLIIRARVVGRHRRHPTSEGGMTESGSFRSSRLSRQTMRKKARGRDVNKKMRTTSVGRGSQRSKKALERRAIVAWSTLKGRIRFRPEGAGVPRRRQRQLRNPWHRRALGEKRLILSALPKLSMI